MKTEKITIELNQAIAMAKKKETKGFNYLYNSYFQGIYRYLCYISRDPVLAEDLTHETFLKIFEDISSLKNDNAFKSWAFQVAYRVFLYHKRLKKNQVHSSIDTVPEQYAKVRSVALMTTITTALDSLSPTEKEVLLMIDLGDLSQEEAAVTLKIPIGIIKSKIRLARSKFIEYCKTHGIEFTGFFNLPTSESA